MPQPIESLYNTLTNDGYSLGDLKTFSDKMLDPAKAKVLHDSITKDGYQVGDYDSFLSKLGHQSSSVLAPKHNFGIVPGIDTTNLATHKQEETSGAPKADMTENITPALLYQEPYKIPTMYGNTEQIKPDPKGAFTPEIAAGMRGETNPNPIKPQVEENSFIGDVGRKMAAGAVDAVGNAFGALNNFPSMVTGLPMPDKTEVQQYINDFAQELRTSADRYKGKDVVDLWKEGKKVEAVGDVVLQGAESLPMSLAAMFGGPIGLASTGLVAQTQQYDNLRGNTMMSEDEKRVNSMFNGAIQMASEQLGDVPIGKMLKGIAGKTSAEAVGETVGQGVKTWVGQAIKKAGLLFPIVGEGLEEVAAQVGTNVTDYLTGAKQELDIFDGVVQAGIYGAGAGAGFSIAGGALTAKNHIQTNINHKQATNNLTSTLISQGLQQEDVDYIKENLTGLHPSDRGAAITNMVGMMPSEKQQEVANAVVGYIKSIDQKANVSGKFEEKVKTEREKTQELRQAEITTAQQQATAKVQSEINPDMDAVVHVQLQGVENPVRVFKGQLNFTDDGKIDDANSDRNIYYTDGTLDANGLEVPRVTHISMIGSVVSNVPSVQAYEQAAQVAAAPLQAKHANDDIRPYEVGEVIRINPEQPSLGKIVSKTENGYIVKPQGFPEVEVEPRAIINDDHIRTIEDEETITGFDGKKVIQGKYSITKDSWSKGLAFIDGTPVLIESIQREGEQSNPFAATSTDKLNNQLGSINNALESGALNVEQSNQLLGQRQQIEGEIARRAGSSETVVGSEEMAIRQQIAEQRALTNLEVDTHIAEAQKRLGLPTTPDIEISDDTETTLEMLSNNEPVTNDFILKASGELYEVYKNLEAIIQSDTRLYTIEQIESMKEYLGEEITKLENYATQQRNGEFIGKTQNSETTDIGTTGDIEEINPIQSENEYANQPYPVNEKGELDFDNFNDEQLFNYNREQFGDGAAISDLTDEIKTVQKQIISKNKSISKVGMKDRIKLRRESKELTDRLNTLSALLPVESSVTNQFETQKTIDNEPSITQESNTESINMQLEGNETSQQSTVNSDNINPIGDFKNTPEQKLNDYFDTVTEMIHPEGYKYAGKKDYTAKKGNFVLNIHASKNGYNLFLGEPSIGLDNIPTTGQLESWFPETEEEFLNDIDSAIGLIDKYSIEPTIYVSETPTPEGEQDQISVTSENNNGDGVDNANIDKLIAAQEPNLNPTEAQVEAGNYKLAHIAINGMDISVENPVGSFRSGKDADGKEWSNEMFSHYGYFKGTVGRDGDHVDVFTKSNTPEDFNGKVYVIDQVHVNGPKSGLFDESKVMLGYDSAEEATKAYMENYDKDWNGLSEVTEVGVDDFKTWLYDGKKQKKPFAEYKDTPSPVESEKLSVINDVADNKTLSVVELANAVLQEDNNGALYQSLPDDFDSLKPAMKIHEVQKIITGLNGKYGIKTTTHVLLKESSVLNQMLINGHTDAQINSVKEDFKERKIIGMSLGNKNYILANNVHDTQTLLKVWLHELTHIHVNKQFTEAQLNDLYSSVGKGVIEKIIPKKDTELSISRQSNEAVAYTLSELLDNNTIENVLDGNYDISEIPVPLQDALKQILNSINNENNKLYKSGGRIGDIDNKYFDGRTVQSVRETDGRTPETDRQGNNENDFGGNTQQEVILPKSIKQLESENKTTLPKIPTPKVFLNKVGAAPWEEIFRADRFIDKLEELPTEKINVSDIIPTQRSLTTDNLKSVKNITEEPYLLKYDEKYYVIDGHHRIANQILDGNNPIDAKVFDANTAKDEPMPEKPQYMAEKSIPEYAAEITAYNEKIASINERKKALKAEHERKQISNTEFVDQAEKLNDEKSLLETKVKRIEAGTSVPSDFEENQETTTPLGTPIEKKEEEKPKYIPVAPPVQNEGEGIVEFSIRVAEWWKTESKNVSEITKELNKANAELKKLKYYRNEIVVKMNKVSEINMRDKDILERTKRTAEELESYIKDNLSSELADWMGLGEFNKLMARLHNPTNKKDIEDAVMAIDRALNNIEIRKNQKTLNALLNTKVLDQNKKGVSIAKTVDDDTRRTVEYIRTNKDLSEAEIDALITEIENNVQQGILSADNIQTLANLEIVRLLANINVNQRSLAQIDAEIMAAEVAATERIEALKKEEPLDKKALKAAYDQRKNIVKSLRKERLITQSDINETYDTVIRELNSLINTGKSNLLEQKEKDLLRRNQIAQEAIDAVSVKKILSQAEKKDKAAKTWSWEKFNDFLQTNWVKEFLLKPQGSFNYMLKHIDRNHPMGEGKLYKRFMKSDEGAFQARETSINGEVEFRDAVIKKAQEIFGIKFNKILEHSRLDNGSRLEYMDANGETHSSKMTNGELMYIYMVSKMKAGLQKLERMGISSAELAQIEGLLGDQYIQMAEWIQKEFLPEKRKKYNETHKRLFGTSMAKVENYFPFKYNSTEIQEKTELGRKEGYGLPSTMTGSIINRTRNSKQIDISANAFDVLMENGHNMEKWNAYAPLRKDLNALLNNLHVQNLIKANNKNEYDKFKESASVATEAYDQKKVLLPGLNELALKVNGYFARGAISFRINTALNQILAYPAFIEYSINPKYIARLGRNLSPDVWVPNWKWAKENLPGFNERISSGNMGNERLLVEQWEKSGSEKNKLERILDGYTKSGMFLNRTVDAFTVVAGAKSIYDYAKIAYLKGGMSQEEANRMALFDAGVAYNESQQSSRPEFLAPIQKSRNALDAGLGTFMNNSFGYMREGIGGINQIARKSAPQIAQLTKENIASGMNAEEAEAEAERVVYGAKWKAGRKSLLFLFLLPILWQLKDMIVYGIGDDDDEKEKDILKAISTAPISGLYGGSALTAALQGYGFQSPLMSATELEKIYTKIQNAAKDNGYFSPAVGLEAAKAMLQGGGINYDTWFNMYTAGELAIKNGEWNATNTFYMLNAPASVRKSYANKMREGESITEYAARVTAAYDKEIKAAEQKKLILKKVYSDKGDMTRFNRANEFAKEWHKLQTKEKEVEEHSERYKELEEMDKDYVLTDFYDKVNDAVKWYKEGLKLNEVFTKEEMDKDKAEVDELIKKIEEEPLTPKGE